MCEVEQLQTVAARDRLLALLSRDEEGDSSSAVACLAELLSSRDRERRRQGYALFSAGVEDALFRSCLNYGALVHGFTHPLLRAVEQAIEHWAQALDGAAPAPDPSPPQKRAA